MNLRSLHTKFQAQASCKSQPENHIISYDRQRHPVRQSEDQSAQYDAAVQQ